MTKRQEPKQPTYRIRIGKKGVAVQEVGAIRVGVLADEVGISRRTEAGQLERQRLQRWVPEVIALVELQKHEKATLLTPNQELERLNALASAAAALTHQLKDKQVDDAMIVYEMTMALCSSEWRGDPDRNSKLRKLTDRLRAVEQELTAVRIGVANMRIRLEAMIRLKLQVVDHPRFEGPSGRSKPWLHRLAKECRDYHRQHLVQLKPKVSQETFARAIFALFEADPTDYMKAAAKARSAGSPTLPARSPVSVARGRASPKDAAYALPRNIVDDLVELVDCALREDENSDTRSPQG